MLKKVAFIGDVGSGKTTIIGQLSSTDTIDTDVESTIDIGKEFTTVGIDYGHIHLGNNMSLGLYGVPGQERFSFVWDFVKQGLWGVVILVKNNNLESLDKLIPLIKYFEVDEDTPCVVGITHAESRADRFLERVHTLIKEELGFSVPVYTVDARNYSSAMLIMRTLIAIEDSINRGGIVK